MSRTIELLLKNPAGSFFLLPLLFIPLLSGAVPVSYSGTVKNTSGNAIALARVAVAGTTLSALTDSLGAFLLAGDDGLSVVSPPKPFAGMPFVSMRGRTIKIDNPRREPVRVASFTADGRCIVRRECTAEAQVTIGLPDALPALAAWQMLFIKVTVGSETALFRLVRMFPQEPFGSADAVASVKGLAKSGAAYTLQASAAGYKTGTFDQAGPQAAGLVLTLAAQTSDTLDKFQAYFTGSGEIQDIVSGRKVVLSTDRMIHVIVLPEGYTAADLAAGRYETDLKSFYQSIFAFNPLPFFRQAFAVWKYPVASNAHVAVDGSADTYFRIPVTSSGVSSTLDTATRRVWNLLSTFPHPPNKFYPASGNTYYLAKNVIVQFLILDATQGRAGYSGLTTRFTNPSASTQRVSVSLGQDQSHEFMHSYGLLADEYYDASHSPLSSSTVTQNSANITNVVYTDSCAKLPWQHLLKGGRYNPGVDSLVGAFGASGRFHPEFKCLLNGTHTNATLYGGNGFLRVYDRLCNFCGEITAFRTYERVGVLANTDSSYAIWVASYRDAYYAKFPFIKPAVVPQRNSANQAWFVPCR